MMDRISLAGIPGALQDVDGLPRANWDVIHTWIAKEKDDQRASLLFDAASQWLERVKERLGGSYEVYSSDRFLLLTADEEATANKMIWLAERAWDRVTTYLETLPPSTPVGPHVVLQFDRVETYYTYISYFYSDGEYGHSGGMFLESGYPHIALPPCRDLHRDAVLVHELTHWAMKDLQSPQWVEEGIAQILEEQVLGFSWFRMDHELAGRQRAYWRTHGLQTFWSGEAFSRSDESQELSYTLARVLIQNMANDHGADLLDSVRDAARGDAGEKSAIEHLGVSLADCAAQFLGPGAWKPDPDALRRWLDPQSDTRD